MQSKKYSKGEFPSDDEIMAASRRSGPGCLGLTYMEWGSLLAAVLTLYVTLGLLYWALITAAVEVRGDGYIELPDRFFGDFSKVERTLTNAEGKDVLVGEENPTEGKGELRRMNYPDGCTVAEGGDIINCGQEQTGKNIWSIFPWVALVDPAPGCENRRYTSLVNDPDRLLFALDGELADNVCINGKLIPEGER